MIFDGFYGNERAKEYLSSSFARNSLPHALLIVGEKGIGKKTLAGIISKALVCTGNDVPCSSCNSCYKADNNIHPDIVWLGSDEDSVKVDDIRNLKHDAFIRPNDSERKVYILDHAESLTPQAQNAFLKILEEPPHFTFFILLCNNLSDLLPTIVSRTAHIILSPLSDEDVGKVISKNCPDISESEKAEIIRTCGGICSFLGNKDDNEHSSVAVEIINSFNSKDELSIFQSISKLDKSERKSNLHRIYVSRIFDELIYIFRDAIIKSSNADAKLISHIDSFILDNLVKSFPQVALSDALQTIMDAKEQLSKNIGTSHITGALTCKLANIVEQTTLKG